MSEAKTGKHSDVVWQVMMMVVMIVVMMVVMMMVVIMMVVLMMVMVIPIHNMTTGKFLREA